MKKIIYLLSGLLFFPGTCLKTFAQLDVKGKGTTDTTYTLVIKNNNLDTSLVVLDGRKIGIDTSKPQYPLDVNGLIFARTGVLFPDGTIQTLGWTGTVHYSHVFTVALSGGDFTTINAALAACVNPTKTNQYLIRVMPGNYNEPTIPCKKFVHLAGAGKYSATIFGQITATDSCVIENFSIKNGIKCAGTSPAIVHNIITNTGSASSHGIHIFSQGNPWIRGNEIVDCEGWGILCEDFGSDPWIIENKILRNTSGGIKCDKTSPTISNNIIDNNHLYGIYLTGILDAPTEPTIDDNVIGHTDKYLGGIGIYMTNYAEPRVIANDIYLNGCGIEIHDSTQPSILSNNINYNIENGIRCYSNGAKKRVVITSNHIHSNTDHYATTPAGLLVATSNPIITLNNISQNDRVIPRTQPDIDYSGCTLPPPPGVVIMPSISLNVFDIINRPPNPPFPSANGSYNVDSQGNPISP